MHVNGLLSFSLFGKNPVYIDGAIRTAEEAPVYYPEWRCRYYLSQEISSTVAAALKELGAEVVRMEENNSRQSGMFWRFFAASDPDYTHIIFRDTDSLLCERDARCTQDWIASGKAIHIIRDHPQHQSPILGGLWGIRGGLLPDAPVMIDEWRANARSRLALSLTGYRDDQAFLTDQIYSRFVQDALIHSEFVRYEGEITVPLPHARSGFEFLGQRFPEKVKLQDKQQSEISEFDGRIATYSPNIKPAVIQNLIPRMKDGVKAAKCMLESGITWVSQRKEKY